MTAGVSGTVIAPGESSPAEADSRATGSTPAPRGPRPRPTVLTRRYWNTPRRVRALTALCLVALLTAGAVAASVLTGARDGIDTVGHQAAPQAVRAADLSFALSDMDAQAANLLLIGADPDYAALRKQTQDTYEQRRAQADADLQGAAEASAHDPAGQRAVQTVFGQLGQYEALVARTQLLEDQAHAPAAKPPAAALDTYRQATDLLRQQLLPAAEQVTAANAGSVDRVYQAQRGDLAAGWWWVLATGLLALLALAVLQRTLAVRFRRLVNLPLAAVTLLTALALAAALTLTSRAAQHLAVAKSNAYDSVIALSQARATAYDMNADESRYLIDPDRAAAYQQSFFDKTQSIVRLEGTDLAGYNAALAGAVRAHAANRADVPFAGFLGTELRNITFNGEQQAADRALNAFQTYQVDDRKIRDLRNQGRLKDAVTLDTGSAPGQSDADFELFSSALGDVLTINQRAMDQAVADADGDLGAGPAVGGALVLAAALTLTVLAVRPRLREYH
ncbi:hypothetical protein P3T37_007421 [Kitasatospora sp. MAA4]|uniref:hypothetical protein n=1 Tax=Kitasatospora sp. MAA4 TaxID=3035093 RepID=UPI0024732D7A|nr:hypothetical protein [Kitasatospora sp. MAA4]MDH6137978.1 hypothetical protein [Kitasatospora sp. MAA4]